jgi:hypothetical protein
MKINKYEKYEDGSVRVELVDEDGKVIGHNLYSPESSNVPRDPNDPTLWQKIVNLFGGN